MKDMKIRNLVIVSVSLLCCSAMFSCKKSVVVEQENPEPKITLSRDEIEFNQEASEMYISLESNVDWTASSESDWVTVDPLSGKAGDKKVKIVVGENKLSTLRSALVRFSATGVEEYVVELIVNQGYKSIDPTSPYLKLDKDAVTFGADASEEYVTLETNLSWKVSKSESWVSIDPSEGDAGTRKVRVSATKNNLTSERSGTLTFSDIYEKYSFDVVVRQAAAEPIETEDYIDEDGENHGKGIAIDGVIWAPVNCGHKKSDIDLNGRLYQWGRRYGIENHSDSKVTEISGPVPLEVGQSKENENIYIKVSDPNTDWLTETNNSLWRNGTPNNPIKTEYDPCPNGWRVPTKAELTSLSKNHSTGVEYDGQRGRWFSGETAYSEGVIAIFLPGERGSYAGANPGFATWPNYWTSDVDNSSRPWCLEFDSIKGGGRCGMNWQVRKSRACSIRCVKEKSNAD